MSDNGTNKYTTSRGITVEFCGIATLLDKLQAAHSQNAPKPPTYQQDSANGKVTFDHDATTIETDEEKAAWAEYVKAREEHQAKYNLALTRLVLMRGLIVEMPQDNAWEQQQKFLGIPVPVDALERRMHWLETEVIGGVADMEKIMLGVMGASGVPEELLSQMAESFRHPLERDTTSESENEAGQVDSHAEIRTSADRVQAGQVNERVGRRKRRG